MKGINWDVLGAEHGSKAKPKSNDMFWMAVKMMSISDPTSVLPNTPLCATLVLYSRWTIDKSQFLWHSPSATTTHRLSLRSYLDSVYEVASVP